MADTKISDLAAATTLADTDLFVIAQEDTANKKVTFATLRGYSILHDQTLGSAAASIDTGAGGIAGGFTVMTAYAVVRTTAAAVQSSATVQVNNDGSAIYDRERMGFQSAGAVSTAVAGGTSWAFFCHGDAGVTDYATLITITIPFYDSTTWNKVGAATDGINDDATGEQQTDQYHLGWRSTAAITRLAVTAGSGNLMAGSRLLVVGL